MFERLGAGVIHNHSIIINLSTHPFQTIINNHQISRNHKIQSVNAERFYRSLILLHVLFRVLPPRNLSTEFVTRIRFLDELGELDELNELGELGELGELDELGHQSAFSSPLAIAACLRMRNRFLPLDADFREADTRAFRER